jgi:glyoxylase-like metal-dependent hydrolase (beta-lactamase superfamily II)
MTMRLTSRIYLVGSGLYGFGLTNDYDCHVYLVDCGSSAVLIDSGAGLEVDRIAEELRRDGFAPDQISHVLLTHGHADHSGGAAHFQSRYGSAVIASPQAGQFLRTGDEDAISLALARSAGIYPPDYRWSACPVERILEDQETITIGECRFTAINTPGHCSGHISFLLPTEDGDVLFAGDAVFHNGQVLVQAIPDCSIWEYRQTIRWLQGLHITTLLPGHLGLGLRNGQAHIAAAARAFHTLLPPRNIL